MSQVNFPSGDAEIVLIPDEESATLTVHNSKTIIRRGEVLSQDVELCLAPGGGLLIGAEVIVDIQQTDEARSLSFDECHHSSGQDAPILAPDLVGVAQNRDVLTLFFDGKTFIATGGWVKAYEGAPPAGRKRKEKGKEKGPEKEDKKAWPKE